jgi:hypothetical protein
MVKESKLVLYYSQILRSLLNDKYSVNQLYNKTGLSKNKETTQVKENLEKSLLIIEKNNKKVKDKKFHSQSHIIELSDFGYSVAMFLKNLDDFESSFSVFSDKIENIIGKNLISGTSKLSRGEIYRSLNSEGWNLEKASSFYTWITNLLEFKEYILRSVLEAVSFRYGYFITKFNPNTTAIEIVKKIIGDKIMQYNFLKMDIIANMPYMKHDQDDVISNDEKEINNYKIDKMYETFSIYFMEPINFAQENFLFNKHISQEIKNLLIYLKSLTELKRDHVDLFIDLVISNIEELDSKGEDKNNIYFKEHYRKELALYNELFPET